MISVPVVMGAIAHCNNTPAKDLIKNLQWTIRDGIFDTDKPVVVCVGQERVKTLAANVKKLDYYESQKG